MEPNPFESPREAEPFRKIPFPFARLVRYGLLSLGLGIGAALLYLLLFQHPPAPPPQAYFEWLLIAAALVLTIGGLMAGFVGAVGLAMKP
jgi:hypothetical protein